MLSIRPLRLPDEFGVHAVVYNAAFPEEPRTEGDLWGIFGPREVKAFYVAEENGATAGTAWVMVDGSDVPDARVLVVPPYRRRGIGTALFRVLSGWAAVHGHSELRAHVLENEAGVAFARRLGFAELARETTLELDLTAIEPPPVDLPDGIEIVSWADRPDLTRAMYDLDLVVVPEIPGAEDWVGPPFEEWLAGDMGGPIDRRPATFIALAGGEVVGSTTLLLRESTPTVGNNAGTLVAREWRGRGVARSLKATQIRWAVDAGLERLVTENEERNAPIRRLNARFGYRPAERAIVLLRGPIAPS